MRRAAKIDGTQTAIVDALRAAGCRVLSLAACGNGVPDLLVKHPVWCFFSGERLILMEVKNPKGKGIALTERQVRFHAEWPVVVVTSVDEALRAVGVRI